MNMHANLKYLALTRKHLREQPLSNYLYAIRHKLMMEIGKYNQINRVDRHCPSCGCNQINSFSVLLLQILKNEREFLKQGTVSNPKY